MQQRRGTAAQWISTNSGNGPILNAGEIGYETDTNKFKIGDGTNHWIDLDYFVDSNSTVNPSFGSSIAFEGATLDSYKTTLLVTDPTANRTITLPNATGTVALTSDIAELSQDAIDAALTAGTGITKNYNDAANTLTLAVDTTAIQARVTGVSDTEIGYLDGVTSAIQTQLDAKSTASKTETLTNKTLTSPVINTPTGITKSDVGLANVDNTADSAKPVSTATQTALDLKAPLASPTFTGTVVLPSTVNGPGIGTSVNLLSTTTSGDITLGLAQTTGNVTIGGGSTRTTGSVLIGTGATSTGTKTINIGTGSTGGTTAITVGSSSGATSNITLNGTVTAANNLVVTGDLTVNGTTTNLNSTSLVIEDKNIVLADVATPTNTTADGAGITVNGTTNKTFNWVNATSAWTSSEHIDLASGKSYYANGTLLKDVTETLTNKTISGANNTLTVRLANDVTGTLPVANGGTGATDAATARTNLGATTLGANIFTQTNPSAITFPKYNADNTVSAESASTHRTSIGLGNVENTAVSTWAGSTNITTLGTIATGTWSGTAIALNKGGTGATTQAGAANAVLPSQTSASGKYLTSDGTNASWGTVSSYSAPTLGSTSIASGATVTTIAGLTLNNSNHTGTFSVGGSAGTSGQVLSSTGSGVQWIAPSQGAAFSELLLVGC